MKTGTLLAFIVLLTINYISAQDTVIVENFYKHDILNNRIQNTKKTIYQNIRSQDGKLRRQIRYADSATSINGYTFYFYNINGQLIAEEIYGSNDNILYIIDYDYRGNQMIKKQIKKFANQQTTESFETEYQNKDNQIVASKSSKDGKRIAKMKCKILSDTSMIYSKSFNGSTFISLDTIKYTLQKEFSKSGELLNEVFEIYYRNKPKEAFTKQYMYSEINSLVDTIKYFNETQELYKYSKFKYYYNGNIESINTKSASNEPIEFITVQTRILERKEFSNPKRFNQD